MPFIRPMDVEEATQDGDTMFANFTAQDEAGGVVFCRMGFKSDKGRPTPGVDIEIQPVASLSTTPGKPTYVRRVQAQGGQRGGYGGGGGQRQNTPQNAQQRPQSGSSPQQAPAPVPTMSQAVGVLKECIDAVAEIGGSDGHATTLFLARLKGQIRRNPTEAETQADAAAKAKAAADAKAEAERLAAEAAKQAALAAMPQPAQGADDEIPF